MNMKVLEEYEGVINKYLLDIFYTNIYLKYMENIYVCVCVFVYIIFFLWKFIIYKFDK